MRKFERTERIILVGIWLLWGLVWGWHLSTLGKIPGGLFYDEAYNALDAIRVGHGGYWPAFLPRNFGREPLMVYVMAASLRFFGHTIWAVRLPAAIAWGGTFPALYWVVQEMFADGTSSSEERRKFRQRVWFVAALVLLTSLWFNISAHYAIRTSWFVFVETLFFASLWHLWHSGGIRSAIVTGLFGGLLFYTYLPNRLIPLILGAMLIVALQRSRYQLLQRWSHLLIAALVALSIMIPALVYFAQHPGDFFLRISQVSLVMGGGHTDKPNRLLALIDNTRRVAGMFFLHGDHCLRNNIPGRPVLTWFATPLFLIGMIQLLLRREGKHLFLLSWFVVMLLPTLLSEYAPDFQRAVGAIPPLVLIVGLGGTTFVQWMIALPEKVNLLLSDGKKLLYTWLVVLLVGLMVSGEGVASVRAFQEWAAMPSLYYAFDGGLTQVGKMLASFPTDTLVYLSPERLSHPTIRFFLQTAPGHPEIRSFDGRYVLVASPGRDATYVVIVHEDFRFELMAPWLWNGYHPKAQSVLRSPDGAVYAKVFRIPGTVGLRKPRFSLNLLYQDNIKLVGYDPIVIGKPGGIIYLQLWWQAVGTSPRYSWTVFTHLLDAKGKQVSGKDCEPGCGTFPTDTWTPGELIVSEYQIPIPANLPDGEYTMEVGLYNWRTGKRLPLKGSSVDAVRLGKIHVRVP